MAGQVATGTDNYTSLTNLETLQKKSYDVVFNLSGTNYRSCRNIGSGTYGVVCSAVHLPTGQSVAIKKVHNVFDNLILARRTYREMKILRHFHHDNIIRIREILRPASLDSFSEIYLVLDLMESDLHQVIYSNQELSDEHIRYFMFQILSGLNYIHSANVIHRDLKPSNLLVNENCDLKIGDFGMARAVKFADSDYQTPSLLMTWYVMTRWYRAPELLLFRCQYTVAVDVWSVGCIFAEMIARKALFRGKDLQHQLRLIVDVLGSPTEDFVGLAHSDRVKDFLHKLDVKSPVSFKTLFPTAHPKALKLLEKLLRWHPTERISVATALCDLYLNKYYDPSEVGVCQSPITFTFDEEQVTELKEFRELIYNEILSYNTLSKSQTSAMSTVNCPVSVASPTDQLSRNSGHLATVSQSAIASNATTTTANKLPAVKQCKVARHQRQCYLKSQYHPILPATSRPGAHSVTNEPLSTKDLLRAVILSGRHKTQVTKTKRGKTRKKCPPQPTSQQVFPPANLTEEDKLLLERWKHMQETVGMPGNTSKAVSTTNSTATPCQSQSELTAGGRHQRTDTTQYLILQPQTTTVMLPTHCVIVQQTLQDGGVEQCETHLLTTQTDNTQQHDTDLLTTHSHTVGNTVGNTDLLTTHSHTVGNTDLLTTQVVGNTDSAPLIDSSVVITNSADIRLIDACLSEMVWTPPAASAAAAAESSTDDQCTTLDYSPLDQFKDILSLSDICNISTHQLFVSSAAPTTTTTTMGGDSVNNMSPSTRLTLTPPALSAGGYGVDLDLADLDLNSIEMLSADINSMKYWDDSPRTTNSQ